jgi:hypothetical protein
MWKHTPAFPDERLGNFETENRAIFRWEKRRERSVPVAKLCKQKRILHGLVHHPVFYGDSSRPVSGKGMLQWFRLADARERFAHDGLDEFINALHHAFVLPLPEANATYFPASHVKKIPLFAEGGF